MQLRSHQFLDAVTMAAFYYSTLYPGPLTSFYLFVHHTPPLHLYPPFTSLYLTLSTARPPSTTPSLTVSVIS